jgi:hypothetical protein
MRLHHVKATVPMLLAALAGCKGMASPAPDPVGEEAAIRAADALWLVVQRNKAVTVWRKEPDGSWKHAVDIWNSTGTQP